MASLPVRDPIGDHLLTPQNSALVVIDYQPSQFGGVRSIDRERLLANIVSTVPQRIAYPNRASSLDALEAEYASSLATVPEGGSKTEGIAAGNAAADAMIAARERDGRFGPSPWVANDAPGHWQPLLNPAGQPILDPTPWVGGVKPFLIQSSSQFRSDPPPALGSAAYAEQFNEVSTAR